METVKLKDKEFKISISEDEIQSAVENLAGQINTDYDNVETPLFLSILNGSFMFTADILKRIKFNCNISFLKLASYSGTSSTGDVKQLIGLNEDLTGRHIVILEDIVDTGNTLVNIIEELKKYNPADVRVATLLYKPEAYKKDKTIDYIGLRIPNDFIVGYGLDYDGLGRNLPAIYTVVE